MYITYIYIYIYIYIDIYTTPGLIGLWIHLFYFITLDSTCSVLSSEMKHFRAMASDVNSVTIPMDTSFSGVRTTYYYNFCLLLLLLPFTVSIISFIAYMGITVTINY